MTDWCVNVKIVSAAALLSQLELWLLASSCGQRSHSCIQWMRALKKQVKANRKARENTDDYLEARQRARRHTKLKRTQKKLQEELRGKRKAPKNYGQGTEGSQRKWKGSVRRQGTRMTAIPLLVKRILGYREARRVPPSMRLRWKV